MKKDAAIFTGICIIFFAFLFYSMSPPTKGEYIGWYKQDLGTVTRITDCDSGKYRYSCKVVTDKVVWSSLDLTDLPNETLEVSDKLFYEIHLYENLYIKKFCKNNKCMNRHGKNKNSDEYKQYFKEYSDK